MKQISTFLIAFFAFALSVQAQSFNGVPISGDLNTAVARFKAKGFTFVKFTKSGAAMLGSIASQRVELYIYTTVTSKQIYSMCIYFPERSKWIDLKSDYDTYLSILTDKYGEPTNGVIHFDKPYYEGDGYEMTAVSIGKLTCMSLWMNVQNMNIMIDISKYQQVSVTYENKKLADLNAVEKDKLNKIAF